MSNITIKYNQVKSITRYSTLDKGVENFGIKTRKSISNDTR